MDWTTNCDNCGQKCWDERKSKEYWDTAMEDADNGESVASAQAQQNFDPDDTETTATTTTNRTRSAKKQHDAKG